MTWYGGRHGPAFIHPAASMRAFSSPMLYFENSLNEPRGNKVAPASATASAISVAVFQSLVFFALAISSRMRIVTDGPQHAPDDQNAVACSGSMRAAW